MNCVVWVVTEIKNHVLSNSLYNTFTECCDYIKEQFKNSNNLDNYDETLLEKDMFIKNGEDKYYIEDCVFNASERSNEWLKT